jgi:hypothetical protein
MSEAKTGRGHNFFCSCAGRELGRAAGREGTGESLRRAFCLSDSLAFFAGFVDLAAGGSLEGDGGEAAEGFAGGVDHDPHRFDMEGDSHQFTPSAIQLCPTFGLARLSDSSRPRRTRPTGRNRQPFRRRIIKYRAPLTATTVRAGCSGTSAPSLFHRLSCGRGCVHVPRSTVDHDSLLP